MALVMIGVWLLVLLGLGGLAVDVAQLALQKTWLQATADAAALAGVYELPDGDANSVVQRVSGVNYSDGGTVVAASDVQPGRWDPQTAIFVAGGEPSNALRVTARRATVNENPVQTIVMGAFGFPIADLSAVAIATRDGGDRMCFLVDDEMIDTDLSAIQSLASSLGKTPDAIISDGNGDGFIDLPPGTEIELPTGQVGDEGLFEPQPAAFPFSLDSTPFTLEDFLGHQDGQGPIPDDMLDPLDGVKAVADPGDYPRFVKPGLLCVAPVYKSDVSRLGPPEDAQVNAKGERRGLLAFSVLRMGADPDGSGSGLPNLVIRVHDPAEVELAQVVLGSASAMAKLVR